MARFVTDLEKDLRFRILNVARIFYVLYYDLIQFRSTLRKIPSNKRTLSALTKIDTFAKNILAN